MVKPLQVNVPGPKPRRRGKENAPKKNVSTEQQQRKIAVKVAESGRDPLVLQRADGNLVGAEKRELYGTAPLHRKPKVAATNDGTRREKMPPRRQLIPTTASTEPGLSDVIQDLSSDLENFSMNSCDMEFEQPPVEDVRTVNPQPVRSETRDSHYRHPSAVSSSTQQPSVSTSRSYVPRRQVVSRSDVNKDREPGCDLDETRGLETTTTHQTPAARLKARKGSTRQNLIPLAQDATVQKSAISETPHKPPDRQLVTEERRANSLSNMVSDMSLEDALARTAAESQHITTVPSHPRCLATTPGDPSSMLEITSFRPPSASTPYHDARQRHTGSVARCHSKPQDSHFRKRSSAERITVLHSQAAHGSCSSTEDDRGTILAPETPAHLWDLCGSTVHAARLRPVAVRDSETCVVRDSFS